MVNAMSTTNNHEATYESLNVVSRSDGVGGGVSMVVMTEWSKSNNLLVKYLNRDIF